MPVRACFPSITRSNVRHVGDKGFQVFATQHYVTGIRKRWLQMVRKKKIKAKFWLAIKSPYRRRATRDDPKYFDWKYTAWGVSDLLDRSELDDGFLDDHGDLNIEAHVEVLFKSGLQTCCCGRGFRQRVR
ncbi:unnamed protein product [Microthlaspi erraticum]|uniref:MATH domain-containing protein n=1 Tax=Microthlaspi erraticum TaxID=1685480 RepID=A0A6D2HGU6_9BRAS|nr:unnamed protein product [Microthlaspi erraticum]